MAARSMPDLAADLVDQIGRAYVVGNNRYPDDVVAMNSDVEFRDHTEPPELQACLSPVGLALRQTYHGIGAAHYSPEVHRAAFLVAPSFDGDADAAGECHTPERITRPFGSAAHV